jgi:hypothetical protein
MSENKSLFYKMFEKSMNTMKSNLFSDYSESIPITTQQYNSTFHTPLEKILKSKKGLNEMKKLTSEKKEKLKGTKLYYYLTRVNEENVSIWI